MQTENVISTAARQGIRTVELDHRRRGGRGIEAGMVRPEATGSGGGEDYRPGLTASELEKTVESLSEYTGWGNFTIDFGRDEETDSLVIRIIDRDTGEVLRQIPPDQILNLKMHMQEVLGLVFDHMA